MRKFRLYLVLLDRKKRSQDFDGEYTLEEVNEILNSAKGGICEYEIREVVTEERVVEVKTVVKKEVV